MTYKFTLEEAQILLKTHTHLEASIKYKYASHSGFTRRFNRLRINAEQGQKQDNIKSKIGTVSTNKNNNGKAVHKPFISDLDNDTWLNHYCGYYWEKEYLTEMRDRAWTANKLLILFPRGHGKTWSMIGLFVRFLLETRKPILVFCSGSNKSDIYFAVLELLESDAIMEDYGYTVHKQNENRGEIWLKKSMGYRDGFIDPNFKIVGQLAKSIGKHPSWIHLEDIVQDIKASDEAEERVKRWFARVVKFMKKRGMNSKTRLTITGTRKDINDFYEYTMKEHKYATYHVEALELTSGRYPTRDEVISDHDMETCEIIGRPPGKYRTLECPDWAFDALLYEYLWHPYDFEAEMQNNPIPSKGRYFKDCIIDIVSPFTDGELTHRYYMYLDPARGKSKKSSDSAFFILAPFGDKIYIVDVIIGKFNDTELGDKAEELANKYDPIEFKAEDDFEQLSSNSGLIKRFRAIRGFRTFLSKGFGDKLSRIEQ